VEGGWNKWGACPGAQAKEVHQHTIFSHLDQNMLKNVYFLKKSCKIAAVLRALPLEAAGGSAPKIPTLLLLPTAITLSSAFQR